MYVPTLIALAAPLVSLAAAGCGDGEDPDFVIRITHDVCASIGVTTAPEATEAQLAAIDRALELWRAHGVPHAARVEASAAGAGATIEIRFEPGASISFGQYDDAAGVVYVNARLEDPESLTVVVAHELGHAFGLLHVEDRTSVMSPGNYRTPPNAGDRAALEALWGPCDDGQDEDEGEGDGEGDGE